MRFLIIGAGSAGQRHFGTLTALGVPPGSIAVTDVATIPFERFPGATTYPQHKLAEAIQAFLNESSEPSAAIIATPPIAHMAIATQCVAKGMHVLIEKPLIQIGSKISDAVHHAAQLDLAAMAKHLTVMVGYPYRYSNGFRRILGEVQRAESVYSVYSYYGNKAAAHPKEEILSRVTVHQLNYVRTLLRHIGAPVGTELTTSEPEVLYSPTDAALVLETKLCPGFIASNLVSENRHHFVTIETSSGTLHWEDSVDDVDQMNKTMMSHFITSCNFNTPPDTGLHDALVDVRLLQVRTR